MDAVQELLSLKNDELAQLSCVMVFEKKYREFDM